MQDMPVPNRPVRWVREQLLQRRRDVRGVPKRLREAGAGAVCGRTGLRALGICVRRRVGRHLGDAILSQAEKEARLRKAIRDLENRGVLFKVDVRKLAILRAELAKVEARKAKQHTEK